jgi:phosphohistidine phosphatase
MKRLGVLRHAKSSWDDEHRHDFDRPLNERGWKAARRMSREFAQRGIHFDFVLASPAARARETVDGLIETLNAKMEIRFDADIYLASVAKLLEIVRRLPESAHAPLIVGHNPGLQSLVVELAGSRSGRLRKDAARKFPTAAFASLELPADRWSDVEPATGSITVMIFEKQLN